MYNFYASRYASNYKFLNIIPQNYDSSPDDCGDTTHAIVLTPTHGTYFKGSEHTRQIAQLAQETYSIRVENYVQSWFCAPISSGRRRPIDKANDPAMPIAPAHENA